ncbi:LacI family DNA-binding transcriptional regulator [Streptomyces sp. NPDC102462]|uniref:LacI family DNA-binding transcriptional regulator n=1 Tax=Streptomyces sp. NPDC102462 TaxID=3366178 RepID=UPI0037FC4711
MAEERKRRRPTQIDIARRAGVSQATVSQVINGVSGDYQIAPATRQRVLDAVRELGYVANPVARSLKSGRNQMLGLYTFEAVFPTDHRDFYHPFLQGVEAEAAERGYDLVLFTSAGAARERGLFAGGANRLKVADGCVLLGRHLRRAELARLAEEDFPFVFIGRREIEGARISYVAADYATATSRIVAELAKLGHRRIRYLKVPGDAEPTRDRLSGFRRGLKEAGLEPVGTEAGLEPVGTEAGLEPVGKGAGLEAVGKKAGLEAVGVHLVAEPGELRPGLVRTWLDDGVTAFVVEPTEDDRAAAALCAAAEEAGAAVPADCSVAVLGDPPSYCSPPRDWMRFAIPREQMGRDAVDLLIGLLNTPDAEARTLLVPCAFLRGATAGPVPGAERRS